MEGGRVGRLFVGIPFPAELREGLEAYLRATFGERMPGRPVPPGNWHLTLRFLGDTDAARHQALVDELRAIEPGPAFGLSLAGLGAFPRAARATVLWIGVGDGAAELRVLAAKVEAAAVRAGFAPEPKPYSPHLTLSRIQPSADLRRAIEGAEPFGGRMTVDGFVLFRSHLGGGPPRYERMLALPLG
ncbi:RNA 2',3'-cyclic phosphodiesterase [Longimicrobium sp.]|uniref:RNA 2',3'-cyclic phosphodiesterase n=1 Tax=Longimicrobium sp. TaxID=2029185 RepID=UPI002CC1BC53|nr:RNA 2',3'-cyclic phosphodiesterase [Longimicrobium sp.]HSU15058.1 RNA 2',3'-cyclic phosphodiesterase [Longimicrobium sp.]